jgi:uncharacterized integral membrane protein
MTDSEHPVGGGPVDGVDRKRQVRLGVIGALAILGLVLVVQNSVTTEVSILWWSVRMPLFFLLVAMVALGVGLDRLWSWRRGRK